MNFLRLQVKAAATAFVLFGFTSLALFLLARGLGNVAAALPFNLPPYSPNNTIGAVLDLRGLVAIAAGILLAVAFVLVVRSAFLDRAVYMLVSMLTLVLASSIGIVAGYSAYLFITEHRVLVPPGVVPAAIAFGVLLVISLASLDGLRSSLVLRTLLFPVLVVGAPMLLMYGS